MLANFMVVPSAKLARKLPTDLLHEVQLSQDRHLTPAAQGIADAELRRREAWSAPAGRAFWISVVALVVSVVAIILGLK